MLHLVILLLASSGVTLCSHIDREYYLVNKDKSWDEAQRYCRETYMDLASIGNRDDLKRFMDIAEASGVSREAWIGMREGGAASWMWSEGETQTGPGLAVYTNWARVPDPSHHCGSMREDGKWISTLCETTLPFICQEDHSISIKTGNGKAGRLDLSKDKKSSGFYVGTLEKSWRQAQEHCRLRAVDLPSVRSHTENQALKKMFGKKGKFSSLWIGLFRDEWKWSDQSDSSFRYWGGSQPNEDELCALFSISQRSWYDRRCSTRLPFYCYIAKGAKKRKVVKVEMKSSSFLDFSDSAVSEAILNQLQQRYDAVKLQWRVQPDGKIFHKKEKKKIKNDIKLPI